MTETQSQQANPSPRWSAITKLVVALTVMVILGAVLIRFKGIIAPILMAFIVAYLLYPLAALVTRKMRLSWKLAVNLMYLLIVLILLALLTLGGVGLVQQVQNLIDFVQNNIDQIPTFIEDITSKVYEIGPFTLDLSKYLSSINWETIGNQVLAYVEPALGQVGGVVGTVASSAAETLGWIAFIVIVSYFFLLESGGLRNRIIQVNIPVYAEDVRRLTEKLGKIWNAFLRGQMIIFFLTSAVYAVALSILGVRYALVLALITGFANFLPYVGPAINWVVLGLVSYFQPSNMFDLTPLGFTILVIVVAVLIDQVFNNLINPRVMADALKVHPAFVLIAALVAANLLGVIGVIIAAPLLATVQLGGTYIVRKMLDRDPWPPEDEAAEPPSAPRFIQKIKRWWQVRREKRSSKKGK